MRNEFDHRPEPPNGGIFSGDGWKWVLGIAVFVGLIMVCNVAANDAAREDTQSAREAQRWSEGLKTATMSDRASAAESVDCPTSEEEGYFREIGFQFQRQAEWLERLAENNSMIQSNPNIIFDDLWRGNTLFVLGELESGSNYLAEINGPESIIAIRGELELRSRAVSKFVEQYRAVVVAAAMNPTEVPGNPMETAGDAMKEVIRHTNAVGEQGKGFCSQS